MSDDRLDEDPGWRLSPRTLLYTAPGAGYGFYAKVETYLFIRILSNVVSDTKSDGNMESH